MLQGNGEDTFNNVFSDILTSLPDGVVQVVHAALRNKENLIQQHGWLRGRSCCGQLCQQLFIQVNGGLLIGLKWVWARGVRAPIGVS